MENQNKNVGNLTKAGGIYQLKAGGIYQLKVGNKCVDMIYSKNNKRFDECMLNILKQKVRRTDIFTKSHYNISGNEVKN